MLFSVCCPKGTYGTECETCPGGTERPCWGNGECEVGCSFCDQIYSTQAPVLS